MDIKVDRELKKVKESMLKQKEMTNREVIAMTETSQKMSVQLKMIDDKMKNWGK